MRTPMTDKRVSVEREVLLESFAKVKALRDNNPGPIVLPAHDLRAAEKLAMPATIAAVAA